MLYSADRIVWYANTGSANRSALFILGDERFVDKKLNGIRDTILVDLNHDGSCNSTFRLRERIFPFASTNSILLCNAMSLTKAQGVPGCEA